VTNSASLTVNQNVVVASAPVSLTNCPGTSASFSVSATGTGLSYQWFRGGDVLAGQTSSSLVLDNVGAADAGSYGVVVGGACGRVTNSATLSVIDPVMIVSVRMTNGIAVISWNSVAGQTYRLQYKNRLTDTVWQDALPEVLAIGPITALTNAVGNSNQRFYRVAPVETGVARPVIQSIRMVSGIVTVVWSSVMNQSYRLQYKNNLAQPTWVDAAPDVIATGPTTTMTNFVGSAGRRFYRVSLAP
jgi:hypothetical protein